MHHRHAHRFVLRTLYLRSSNLSNLLRWRFTYGDLVCITDETMRHEITSWRLNEPVGDSVSMPSTAIHVVLVVDQSASMSANDVPGYSTRTKAVYHAIANALLKPLLDNPSDGAWFFTVIEMQADASLVGKERMPLTQSLYHLVFQRATTRAKSRRNYLPALTLAQGVLSKDIMSRHKKIVFLSDGAPRDHISKRCLHGTYVWRNSQCTGPWTKLQTRDGSRTLFFNTITGEDTDQEPAGFDCSKRCRRQTRQSVEKECVACLQLMAKEFGQDCFSFQAIAFGNRSEPFTALRSMTRAVKHSSFAVNDLDAKQLNTTFGALKHVLTEVSSEFTSRTGTKPMRTDVIKAPAIKQRTSWDVYPLSNKYGDKLIFRFVWSQHDDKFQKLFNFPIKTVTWFPEFSFALSKHYFWEGAERLVFKFPALPLGVNTHARTGIAPTMLVAKQSKQELPVTLEFHEPFCRTQIDAAVWADKFNAEISKLLDHLPALRSASRICYLDPEVYLLFDPDLTSATFVLVEEFLTGKYTKWNDNAGMVKRRLSEPASSAASSPLDTYTEESEEDPPSYDSDDLAISLCLPCGDSDPPTGSTPASPALPPRASSSKHGALQGLTVEDIEFMVPQCFSHFTYERSDCTELVCDIQGTWNRVDGFMLTDPSIHHRHRGLPQHLVDEKRAQKRYGDTDKGKGGIHKFMETHQCNALCRALSLPNCKC